MKIKINNKLYQYQEIPNVKDKNILKFLVFSQMLYNILRDLLISIINENKKVKTTVGFVGSIIDRMSENLISIILLSSKGFTTDVAILLLNIIELRTDLKFVSKFPEKIEDWFKHNKRHTKPWKFSYQIKEITSSADELHTEKLIYEMCSIAKHGNPAGIDIGFRTGFDEDNVFINENSEYRLTDYLYFTYFYVSDAIRSGLNILAQHGIKFSNTVNKLEELSKEINTLKSDILTRKVKDYVYRNNPELKTIDEEIKRLEKEKENLRAELDEIEKLKKE